ncbi:MAG: ATP-dependent DNA helicase RecG [Bacteroidetes bacterium]|nr:ATP-dependent DNA helicase RecG [Bacteroidota bacterium]
MQATFLETPIEYLKGVGPARAEILGKELQIRTFGELLSLFPFRYIDRSKIFPVAEVKDDTAYVQIRGKITSVETLGKLHAKRLVATLADDTGEIELVWFAGIKWVESKIKIGAEFIVFGKPSWFNGHLNIAHPELEIPGEQPVLVSDTFRPLYSSTEKLKSKGLDSRGLSRLMRTLVQSDRFFVPETLTPSILDNLRLMNRQEAFLNIHFPSSHEMLQKAQARLKFEELFYIQLRLLKQKFNRTRKQSGHTFSKVGHYLNDFYHHYLSFELTNAQKRVIKEIRGDLGSGKQMNRLLQGDVGSGKTLVALMTMLIALDNNFQACMMAPTEILAFQHYSTITKMLSGLDVKVELLTGSTKPAKRKEIAGGLTDGTLHILIGTHALIEENVQFRNLGFVVIDEQHRFGVAQRARLWEKNPVTPHVLVMTATPIPRTLAMTLYGDLDNSVIDEMPPGRKPVITKHVFDAKIDPVFEFIRKQVGLGTQVYIVFPLIQESETLDLKNLMEGYESVKTIFPSPQYHIGMVHGKMKQQEKDKAMERFLKKETQILVATTVIEVGVDIPNASVMVIENAERFGLSQLHQLRGRVGRGADQSYCILVTGYKLTTEAKKRIETMVATNDGFIIAETDLRLRGPGDVEGTQQSGILNLKIADIIRDEKILKYARNLATDIIHDDPDLISENNAVLSRHLKIMNKYSENWGLIS